MSSSERFDMTKLCIHTITTKPLDIKTALGFYASSGVKGVSVWRDAYGNYTPSEVGKLIRDHGLEPVSLCRGGFFPSVDKKKRKEAIEDNLLCIQEASDIGAPLVVLVCGADPAQRLETSRKQIKEGIEAVLPLAKELNVKLAIEPLHPMYADTRSAIVTMGQANDIAEELGSEHVGVAVDVYHVWWDDKLEEEIMRCGVNNNLLAFHICDWKVPTTDFLLDRGIMGEGCIDIGTIKSWVTKAGFNGFNEVEIFSKTYWEMDQKVYLNRIVESYKSLV